MVVVTALAISLLLTGCPFPTGNDGPSSISSADEFLTAITSDLIQDYVLAADLDLSGYSNWEPIGSQENPFTGSLNGNGYTISHLTIRSGERYLGFFGYLGEGARIRNIKLEDVNVSGGDYFGGLAGRSQWISLKSSYWRYVVSTESHRSEVSTKTRVKYDAELFAAGCWNFSSVTHSPGVYLCPSCSQKRIILRKWIREI